MAKTTRFATLIILMALACGCAKRSLVALVPDPDGKSGSISVSNEAGSVAISTPYRATTIESAKQQPTAPENIGKKTLDRMFAEALSIQPARPLHFLLYFENNTTLTSDSVQLLPGIMAAIKERNSTDISIIGHTDTVGSKEYNSELSSNRASTVKKLLIEQGAEADAIRTTSHGKENLLIPTGDNVNEPRNRRVEVVVR